MNKWCVESDDMWNTDECSSGQTLVYKADEVADLARRIIKFAINGWKHDFDCAYMMPIARPCSCGLKQLNIMLAQIVKEGKMGIHPSISDNEETRQLKQRIQELKKENKRKVKVIEDYELTMEEEQDEIHRLRKALEIYKTYVKGVSESGCCMTDGCSIDDPMCDANEAKAALREATEALKEK